MIRVVLCDDHAMVRRGIRDMLSESVDIQITGEAASYTEVRELLRTATCEYARPRGDGRISKSA
jgi:two-component system invasion response regulator UvrY